MDHTRRAVVQLIAIGLVVMAASSELLGQEQIWKSFGDHANQELGRAVDVLGDLTGDGVSEIVTGTYVDSTAATNAGMVRVLSGASGATVYSIYGVNAGDLFGYSVAALGDVDGDGATDFAVGAPFVTNTVFRQGVVTAYSGNSGNPIYSVYGVSTDTLGLAVAAVGDVSGDGVSDFVVGSGVNYALVLSGVDGSLIWTLTSPSPPVLFGRALGGGGDIDGDGVPDIVVGDSNSSYGVRNGGAVSVFSGATGALLYEFGSTRNDAAFGFAVTIPGNANNDSYADILIGAPHDDRVVADGGYAALYSGKDGSLLMSFEPSDGNGSTHSPLDWWLGFSLHGVGDTNDDGVLDLLIGAPVFVDGAVGGSALVFSGRDGGMIYHFQDLSNLASLGFGTAVSPVGDLDSDGLADFIISRPNESNGANFDVGSVSAWKGHKFFVDARARVVYGGETVTITPGQGIAGNPYALFLRDVNGTPTFSLLSLGVLDATGRAVIGASVPFGLGANSLKMQAFTIDGNGKLLASGVETFLTQ